MIFQNQQLSAFSWTDSKKQLINVLVDPDLVSLAAQKSVCVALCIAKEFAQFQELCI